LVGVQTDVRLIFVNTALSSSLVFDFSLDDAVHHGRYLSLSLTDMRSQYAGLHDGLPALLRRHSSVAVACVVLSFILILWSLHDVVSTPSIPFGAWQRSGEVRKFDGTWKYGRDRNNLLLTLGQCDQAFPGLFLEVERARNVWKAQGGVTKGKLDEITRNNGYVRAMVSDQKVWTPNVEACS
jgi:hypothetical protein